MSGLFENRSGVKLWNRVWHEEYYGDLQSFDSEETGLRERVRILFKQRGEFLLAQSSRPKQ